MSKSDEDLRKREEFEIRKGREDEAKNEIRRRILEQASLVEVVHQLQENFTASTS